MIVEVKRTEKNKFPIEENAICPDCSSRLHFAFHVTMKDDEEPNENWQYHDWDIYKCDKCGKEFIGR